jgi:transposase
MFFHRKKSRFGHILQLLQSYRNEEGKSRHRVVLSLGDSSLPKKSWGVVANHVESAICGERQLFDATPEEQSWIDDIVKRIDKKSTVVNLFGHAKSAVQKNSSSEIVNGVLIDDLNHTRETRLGPELLGLHAWTELNMDGLLESLQFNRAQRHAACLSVINRLVDPVPENALSDWLSGSSLPDLLEEDFSSFSNQRYYRVSDKLLRHGKEIETHLRTVINGRFDFERTILLYDLTNTHFEGSCQANEKAKRGRNKQKRHDCPQVVVGVCFDEAGFVQFHKTFAGNTGDSTTLVDMVVQMESCRGDGALLSDSIKPMIIVDAGIATDKNLLLLRRKGFNYLVNDSRKKRSDFLAEFQDEGKFDVLEGRSGKPPVRIRTLDREKKRPAKGTSSSCDASLVVDADVSCAHEERVVLCRSDQRAAKELSIRSGAETKFLTELEKLSQRISKGQLKDAVKIERAIGRIQGRHPRITRYYKVMLEEKCKEEEAVCPSSPSKNNDRRSNDTHPSKRKKKNGGKTKPAICYRLAWTRNDDQYENSDELFGCYVLRSSQLDLSGEKLWNLYMTLSKAESGFRALKSSLGLRPNHHQEEHRVDSHIFITILAYQLLNFILYSLSLCQDTRSWPTVKRILQTHNYSTMLIPTVNEQLYRIRKAGIPELCQQDIYRKLGIDYVNLPKTRTIIQKRSTTL